MLAVITIRGDKKWRYYRFCLFSIISIASLGARKRIYPHVALDLSDIYRHNEHILLVAENGNLDGAKAQGLNDRKCPLYF